MDLRDLNSKILAGCLHTGFQIQVPGASPLPVELTEITERDDSPKLEQFSVIFHNPAGAYLPQGMYELHHETLGEITLFLVPLGPRNGRGMDFQAIFNRFRPDGGSAA